MNVHSGRQRFAVRRGPSSRPSLYPKTVALARSSLEALGTVQRSGLAYTTRPAVYRNGLCTTARGPTAILSWSQTRKRQVHKSAQTQGRIHVLGMGSIGKLVAYALRSVADPPPVTLVYHRPTFKNDFEAAGRVIQLRTGRNTETQDGYDLELAMPIRRDLRRSVDTQSSRTRSKETEAHEPILHLVLTVKAQDTIAALRPIVHRLTPASTILFLQNGMGTVEECNEVLFPDPENRPSYMVGVNTHGVRASSSFEAIHAGPGTITLGVLPRESGTIASIREPSGAELPTLHASALYLLRAMTRVPLLAAVAVSPTDLYQAQVEKLAINCLINPLTVMLDCRNGDLLNNFAISRTMLLLLAEISLVIQSLPSLQGIPNVQLRFSPERLQHLTISVAEKTADNISSMLQDVRRGTQTEVEYINGYIVKKGEQIGIKPVMNYMLMQMVIGKQQMISREIDNYSPFSKQSRTTQGSFTSTY